MLLKIGELAKRAGLTVRALHHYDRIGLLSPSVRSEGGFRLYNRADVVRLHRVLALKGFGCSLSEIRSFLAEPDAPIVDLITRQIEVLEQRVERARTLQGRLSRLREQLARGEETGVTDWLKVLELMTAYETHFTKEELETMRSRKAAGELDRKWRELLPMAQNAMERGVPPDSEEARALAGRWMRLLSETTGDDAALASKLGRLYREQPDAQLARGITPEMIDYLTRSFACAREAMLDRYLTPPETENPGDGPHPAPKPTARRVAVLRAVHQLLDRPLVFEDPLALKILGEADAESLRGDLSGYQTPLLRGVRVSVVTRSRLAEDEWALAQQRGTRQYVILGAGLDTFACRRPVPDGVSVFEVDLPATQLWKRSLLRAASIPEPPSLIFVPLDFENATLAPGLDRAGFRRDVPAFFSWLGVTMYLDERSIMDTLAFIGALPPESGVVFDYTVSPSLLSHREQRAMEAIAARVAERGEPWKTRFDPEALARVLRSVGFSIVEDHGPEQINARYLSGRDDGLRKSGVSRIVCARV